MSGVRTAPPPRDIKADEIPYAEVLRLLDWDAATFEANQVYGFPKALGRSFSGTGWDIGHMKYSRTRVMQSRDHIVALARSLGPDA